MTLQDAAAFASTNRQLRELARMEDPAEEVLCEEILGPGGGYLVGTGLSDQSVFVLKLLSRALFQYTPINAHLVGELIDPFHAALAVSDLTLRAAGLSRGMRREGVPAEPVDVPTDAARLLEAAQISLEANPELARLLQPLVQRAGDAVSPDLSPSRPFVIDDEALTVAYPFEIAAALRHFVAGEIIRAGVQREFALRFTLVTAALLDASMRRLGMTQLGPPEDYLPMEPREVELTGSEALYRFDDNKVAHTMLIVDDLAGYDPAGKLFQFWRTGDLEKAAHERARQVQEHLLQNPVIDVVHTVFVVAPLDRAMRFAVPSSLEALFMPLYDLETFAQASPNDPLALWKLSRAMAELSAAGRLVSFSPLDVHQFLHESNYDLPALDQPTLIVARPGGGGMLREEHGRRLDVHPAPHPSGAGVEVERWLPHAPRVPIYLPRESPWTEFECLVEGDGVFVWIVGPDSEAGQAIGHAIAYWLWQILPDIASHLASLVDASGTLLVRFDLEPAERWHNNSTLLAREPDDRSGPFARVRTSKEGIKTLVFSGTARSELYSADNAGERELLRHVLQHLFGDSLNVDEIVERRASPGYKKQLIFSHGPDPRLSMRGLPSTFRGIQAYDRARAQSTVSRQLLKKRKLRPGVVAADEAHDLIHDYVRLAFEALQVRIAAFASDELLERLILHNERVVQEQAHLRTGGLTNSLAYGALDESFAERSVTQSRVAEAGIATRFLIELAASSPSEGSTRVGLADLDELLALASELTQAGRIGDALYYGLGEPEVRLVNGRLVTSPGKAVAASLAAFQAELFESELATGEAPLNELVWEPPAELVEVPDELEEAFSEEVGIPLSEIGLFLSTLLDYGIETEDGVVNSSVNSIHALLRDAGFTDDVQIDLALDRFSLAPRVDFLAPPTPAGLGDVYPWRTNRSLSFLRRPLVRRGDRVLYGVRHLYNAQSYFARQLEDGRFPAQGKKLRALQGKYGHLVGRSFEDAVAELFEQHGYLHRVRIRRLQGRPLTADGHDLGDIDVLVADEQSQRLIAIDAKSLGPALNTDDVLRQSEQLLGAKRSAATRAAARAEWLAENRDAAAAEFGEPAISSWAVQALVVTDRVLPAAHLVESPVPVLSYGLLKSQLVNRCLLGGSNLGLGSRRRLL